MKLKIRKNKIKYLENGYNNNTRRYCKNNERNYNWLKTT